MPLTDLVRYFNAADQAAGGTLYLEEGRAAAWHRGLRLGSLFSPIVDLHSERIVGHLASLQARREDGSPVTAAEAYGECETDEAIVHFDRLCRTLHALNFLAQQAHAGGYLQLPVHSRHLAAVPSQHGLVYEAILKRCGLAPEDIVLEIDAPQPGCLPALTHALRSYRQRGYRLAFAAGDDVDSLVDFSPAILKLPVTAAPGRVRQARAAGLLVQIEGIASATAYAAARAAGNDLASGCLFGAPQRRCQATHDNRRVTYNSPSPFGVRI